jgi:hypothetical protein
LAEEDLQLGFKEMVGEGREELKDEPAQGKEGLERVTDAGLNRLGGPAEVKGEVIRLPDDLNGKVLEVKG